MQNLPSFPDFKQAEMVLSCSVWSSTAADTNSWLTVGAAAPSSFCWTTHTDSTTAAQSTSLNTFPATGVTMKTIAEKRAQNKEMRGHVSRAPGAQVGSPGPALVPPAQLSKGCRPSCCISLRTLPSIEELMCELRGPPGDPAWTLVPQKAGVQRLNPAVDYLLHLGTRTAGDQKQRAAYEYTLQESWWHDKILPGLALHTRFQTHFGLAASTT